MEILTPKIKDGLSLQFVNLTTLESELVDLISFFQKVAPMSLLTELVTADNLEIYAALG